MEPALLLHSLHCYFLSFGDVDFPVLYMIDRARDGRSYATRTVKAVQKGKEIFVLLASFQKPEPEQPRFQIDVAQHEVFRTVAPPDVSRSQLVAMTCCSWLFSTNLLKMECSTRDIRSLSHPLANVENNHRSAHLLKKACSN